MKIVDNTEEETGKLQQIINSEQSVQTKLK